MDDRLLYKQHHLVHMHAGLGLSAESEGGNTTMQITILVLFSEKPLFLGNIPINILPSLEKMNLYISKDQLINKQMKK